MCASQVWELINPFMHTFLWKESTLASSIMSPSHEDYCWAPKGTGLEASPARRSVLIFRANAKLTGRLKCPLEEKARNWTMWMSQVSIIGFKERWMNDGRRGVIPTTLLLAVLSRKILVNWTHNPERDPPCVNSINPLRKENWGVQVFARIDTELLSLSLQAPKPIQCRAPIIATKKTENCIKQMLDPSEVCVLFSKKNTCIGKLREQQWLYSTKTVF